MAGKPVRCIVFDLSEVLVSGLPGVERRLAPLVDRPAAKVLQAFAGSPLRELCRGLMSEEQYLRRIVARANWNVDIELVRRHIRANFHWKIAGMRELVEDISGQYVLGIYADHAREWVEYVTAIHPFLAAFRRRVFSFEIGKVKDDTGAFSSALERLGVGAMECVYVDDDPRNVEAARAAGMAGIRFSSATGLRAALAAWDVRFSAGAAIARRNLAAGVHEAGAEA